MIFGSGGDADRDDGIGGAGLGSGFDATRPAVPVGLQLAPLARRVVGLVVDQLITVLPVVAVALAFGFRPDQSISDSTLFRLSVATAAVAFVYYSVMIGLLGRTVGKFAAGTKVVRAVDGGRVGWSAAVMRALVPLAFGVVPQIGFVLSVLVYGLAFLSPLRQGLHDRAAGTLVVSQRR